MTLVVFNPMLVENRSKFLLKSHLPVVFLLVLDVVNDRAHKEL